MHHHLGKRNLNKMFWSYLKKWDYIYGCTSHFRPVCNTVVFFFKVACVFLYWEYLNEWGRLIVVGQTEHSPQLMYKYEKDLYFRWFYFLLLGVPSNRRIYLRQESKSLFKKPPWVLTLTVQLALFWRNVLWVCSSVSLLRVVLGTVTSSFKWAGFVDLLIEF